MHELPLTLNATDEPMQPIEFKSALVETSEEGLIVIALFDGVRGKPGTVALLSCRKTVAERLDRALVAVLKPSKRKQNR